MDRRRVFMTAMANQLEYWQRVKNLFGSNLLAYWTLDELSGTVANDRSGNGRNGAYANVTLGQPGLATSRPSASFNGTSSRVNIYSTSLRDAFSGEEGFMSIFIKPFEAATFGVNKRLLQFYCSNGDAVYFNVEGATRSVRVSHYSNVGATFKFVEFIVDTNTRAMNLTATWSKSQNKLNFAVNGVQMGYDVTGLAAFVGTLDSSFTMIGALSAGSTFWKGWASDALVGNRFITRQEMKNIFQLSDLGRNPIKISFLGDSITDNVLIPQVPDWWQTACVSLARGYALPTLHAVSGKGVMDGMDAQVAAAANDNADIIIIELGTNDNNAGNMTTLQATAEAQIAALKVNNPRATIYWMNVLPRWTSNTGATPVDKSNIRAAIAAACTAQSITCWDTFTDPWIAANQTADGLHPIATGKAAIAARVLALLNA